MAILFLGGSLVIGVYLVPKIMKQLAKLRTAGVMLISALLCAFMLSYLANAAGLAAIVGALANLSVLGVAAGLTFAAIIGKQICGHGAWEKAWIA
jgi:Kef-type K+ transport system membrane component KefB